MKKTFIIFVIICKIINFEEIKITKDLWNYKLELFSKNKNLFYRPKTDFSIKNSIERNSNFYNPILFKVEKSKKLINLKITKNCLFPIICINSNLKNNFILEKNNILNFNCEKTNFENYSNMKVSYKKIFHNFNQIPKNYLNFDFYNKNEKTKFIYIYCAVFKKKSILDFSFKLDVVESLRKKDFLIELKNEENSRNFEQEIKLEKNSENSIRFINSLKNFNLYFEKEKFENFEIYYTLDKSNKNDILLTKKEIFGVNLKNLKFKIINKNNNDEIIHLKIKVNNLKFENKKIRILDLYEILMINVFVLMLILILVFSKKILFFFDKFSFKKKHNKLNIKKIKIIENSELSSQRFLNSKSKEGSFISLKFGNPNFKEKNFKKEKFQKKIKKKILNQIFKTNKDKNDFINISGENIQ